MSILLRSASILSVFALLGACAGMSEQACLATDWTTVGFEDGAAGRAAGSIGRYRQQCGEHGITPDLASYRRGHADGVEIYCRAGNGFEVGRRGSIYQNVCPVGLEADFLAAYDQGRHLFELESAVRQVDARIASNERALESIKHELTAIAASMISDETSNEQRLLLVARAAELGKQHSDLNAENEMLADERALHVYELTEYRQTLAARF